MIYVLLGTNQGDREWNLERARALLAGELKSDLLCSQVIETKAIGFEGPDFLNQVVAFSEAPGPEALLDICKKIEQLMGRPSHEAEYDERGNRIYHDRVIDLDILSYDNVSVKTASLTLPHPQVEQRPFVKELLNTI